MNEHSDNSNVKEEVTPTVDTPEPEETAPAQQETPESQPDTKEEPPTERAPSTGRRSGNALAWALLTLIVAGTALLLTPNPWKQPARQWLVAARDWWQPKIAEPPHATAPVAPRHLAAPPAGGSLPKPDDTAREEAAPARPATAPLHAPTAEVNPSEPVASAVMAQPEASETPQIQSPSEHGPSSTGPDHITQQTLDDLQHQIALVARSQQELLTQQKRIAHAALRQQLALLVSSANRLPQMVQVWRNLAQLPGMSERDRDRAQAMQREAATLLAQRERWRKQLREFARQLRQRGTTRRRVALAEVPLLADHPLTAWLDEQFVLYRLPDPASRQRDRLARTLHRVALEMGDDRWPDPAQWQRIRRQLARWIDPRQVAELPERSDTARQQLQALRQQQRRWLEEVR